MTYYLELPIHKSFISKVVMVLAIAFLFFFQSCGRKEPDVLQKASCAMDENSKEALALLEKTDIADFGEEQDSLLFTLLLCQARYKNYLPPKSDSLLNRAFHFFINENADSKYRMIAHYLKGAMQLESGERDSAMLHYLQAQTLAEQRNDQKMQATIHAHLSHLYISEGLDDKALEESNIMCRLGQQTADTLVYADGLHIKGFALYQKEKYAEAEIYLQKAFSMLSSTDFKPQHMIDLCTTLCELYVQTGKAEQALKYAQKGLKYREGNAEDKYEPFLYLGIANIMLCNNDSGVYYLQKALGSNNIKTRCTAYMCLSDISNYLGDLTKANEYERLYSAHRDSLKMMCKIGDVLSVEQKYKAEQQELALENGQNHYAWLYIILIAGAVTLYVWLRRRHKNTVLELKEKNKAEVKDIHAKIQKQDELVEELEKEYEQLKQKYSTTKRIIETDPARGNIIHLLKNIIESRKNGDAQQNSIGEKEWLLIFEEVNARYNGLAQRLSEKGLKDYDLQICCLLLLGFTRNELQFVFFKERSTVYKRVNKILKEYFGITDKDKRLKDVLLEMVQKEL